MVAVPSVALVEIVNLKQVDIPSVSAVVLLNICLSEVDTSVLSVGETLNLTYLDTGVNIVVHLHFVLASSSLNLKTVILKYQTAAAVLGFAVFLNVVSVLNEVDMHFPFAARTKGMTVALMWEDCFQTCFASVDLDFPVNLTTADTFSVSVPSLIISILVKAQEVVAVETNVFPGQDLVFLFFHFSIQCMTQLFFVEDLRGHVQMLFVLQLDVEHCVVHNFDWTLQQSWCVLIVNC